MRYKINTETNIVTDISVGGPMVSTGGDHYYIEDVRSAGNIGDYYNDGAFYPLSTSSGKILNTESLTYEYDESELDDRKSTLISTITDYCNSRDGSDFEYPADSGLYYKVTDAVINTIMRGRDLDDTDLVPCNDGKWDTADGLTSTDFTMGDLKALYDYGYDIPASNYQNMKTHINNIGELSTVQDVVDYDYSTGWL